MRRPNRVHGLQVNVVQLKPFQACVNGLGNISYVCHDFRRHKQLLPGHFTILDSKTYLLLGVVDLGAIKVVVSKLDGSLDRVDEGAINTLVLTSFVPGSPSCEMW